MKKSTIILITIAALSFLLPIVVMIDVKSELKKLIREKEAQSLIAKDLPENIRTIVVRGNNSRVSLEKPNAENKITSYNPFVFNCSGDTLYIDKAFNAQITLKQCNTIVLNDGARLQAGEFKTKALSLDVKDAANLNIWGLNVEKLKINSANNARVSIRIFRCDSLFINAENNSHLWVNSNNNKKGIVKYASGEVKGTSYVDIPVAQRIDFRTEEKTRFLVLD